MKNTIIFLLLKYLIFVFPEYNPFFRGLFICRKSTLFFRFEGRVLNKKGGTIQWYIMGIKLTTTSIRSNNGTFIVVKYYRLNTVLYWTGLKHTTQFLKPKGNCQWEATSHRKTKWNLLTWHFKISLFYLPVNGFSHHTVSIYKSFTASPELFT